jgi:hypothetical protein
MLINRHCANCGIDCTYLKEDGVSSLYFLAMTIFVYAHHASTKKTS